MATALTETKLQQMARKIAAADPLAARLQQVNASAGRTIGVAVRQGRYIGAETIGRKTTYLTDWHGSRAECVSAIEALVGEAA